MAAFNEPAKDIAEPKQAQWRRLDPPRVVRGYIANGWHDVRAVDINDDTHEIRVEWPPPMTHGALDHITHRVLSRDLYQAQLS